MNSSLARPRTKPEVEFNSRCDDLLIHIHELDIPGVQESALVERLSAVSRCFTATVAALKEDAAVCRSRASSAQAALESSASSASSLQYQLETEARKHELELTKLRLQLARATAAARRQREAHSKEQQQQQSSREEWETSLQASSDAAVLSQVQAHVAALKAQHAAALAALEFEFEAEARQRAAVHSSALHAVQAELRQSQRCCAELQESVDSTAAAPPPSQLTAQLAQALRSADEERAARQLAEQELAAIRMRVESAERSLQLQQLQKEASACREALTSPATVPAGLAIPMARGMQRGKGSLQYRTAARALLVPPIRAVSPPLGGAGGGLTRVEQHGPPQLRTSTGSDGSVSLDSISTDDASS